MSRVNSFTVSMDHPPSQTAANRDIEIVQLTKLKINNFFFTFYWTFILLKLLNINNLIGLGPLRSQITLK